MTDALVLTAIALATVLATGAGAVPVIVLGAHGARAAQGVLNGFAAGVMAVAATVGLLVPAAAQGSGFTVAVAAAAGTVAQLTRKPAGAPRARPRTATRRAEAAARTR